MQLNSTPRPAEWLHTRSCLAASVIAAVENMRDAEGVTDHAFRIMLQNGDALSEADAYLTTGTMTCVCA